MDLKILEPKNDRDILEFESTRASHLDPIERELKSWTARWRQEQLQHYLSLGWSYGAFQDNKLLGYVLAQPLLFFRGLTQTLWVEHLSYLDVPVGESLLESCWKWAKDKHFQTVLVSNLPPEIKITRRTTPFNDVITEIFTSRVTEANSESFSVQPRPPNS